MEQNTHKHYKGDSDGDAVDSSPHPLNPALDTNALKCWGKNGNGQLGVGVSDNRGDAAGEMALLGTVNLGTGQTAAQVAMGEIHTCVLLTSTDIKCFGKADQGQLGDGLGYFSYGNSSSQMGDNLPSVNLGVVSQ